MIFPTIEELTQGKFNRYELVIATAKCARLVTDEYVRQREAAERVVGSNKESDRTIASMIKREYRDEKAVKSAIKRLYQGDYRIVEPTEEELESYDIPIIPSDIDMISDIDEDVLDEDIDDEDVLDEDIDDEDEIDDDDDRSVDEFEADEL